MSVQVMIHTLWLFRQSRMDSQGIQILMVLRLKQYATEAVRKQQELVVALSKVTIILLMLWNTTLLKIIHSPGEMSV